MPGLQVFGISSPVMRNMRIGFSVLNRNARLNISTHVLLCLSSALICLSSALVHFYVHGMWNKTLQSYNIESENLKQGKYLRTNYI